MARRKEIVFVIALNIAFLGFWGKSSVKTGQPPVILDFYAPSAIQPGRTWRVFLHAKDNDGDMKDITAMLLELGHAISPTSFTRIEEVEDHAEIEGYLYLHTPTGGSFLGRKLLIKVQVRDRELSRSEAVKLPLTFANVPKENIPENCLTCYQPQRVIFIGPEKNHCLVMTHSLFAENLERRSRM